MVNDNLAERPQATSMSRQERTIEQFCARLSAIEGQQVRIVERPDRDNPGQGGCDAIIDRGGCRFALEHTTVDSVVNQRADDARFNQVVVPLEEAIRRAHPDSWVEIIVPVHAIPTGTDWSQIAGAIRAGCIQAIAQMPFGEEYREFALDGVPFPVWICRREDRHNPVCYVMRQAPRDLHTHLENNMARAIREKRDQLAFYRTQGLPTLLLLDSDEIALANRDSLAGAFRRAADREPPEEFDEVFLAVTWRVPIWIYPVKLYSRLYPDLPEFRRYFEEQCTLTYGEPE